MVKWRNSGIINLHIFLVYFLFETILFSTFTGMHVHMCVQVAGQTIGKGIFFKLHILLLCY